MCRYPNEFRYLQIKNFFQNFASLLDTYCTAENLVPGVRLCLRAYVVSICIMVFFTEDKSAAALVVNAPSGTCGRDVFASASNQGRIMKKLGSCEIDKNRDLDNDIKMTKRGSCGIDDTLDCQSVVTLLASAAPEHTRLASRRVSSTASNNRPCLDYRYD